jgi:hypothetical protein
MQSVAKNAAATERRASRMSLSSIVTKRTEQPMRLLVHGVEKVGKTSFAAGAPSPILICPEDGIPASLGDVPHFPQPADGEWHWQDVLDAVDILAREEHAYKTLIIDTLDWAEPLLWRALCARVGASGIEDIGGGFGKGYTAALDDWRVLLASLERLRRAKGMHVIALAHSWIKAFKDPESDGYDRYELKIHTKAAGLWKEWSDAVLFAKHDDVTTKDKRTKRVRGISTGARLLYTTHHAAYDAGNRYGLPETLPLDWGEFERAVRSGQQAPLDEMRRAITEKAGQLDDAAKASALDALKRAGDDNTKLGQLNNWLNAQIAKKETP